MRYLSLRHTLTQNDYAALEQTVAAIGSVIETKLLEERLNTIVVVPPTLDELVVVNMD